MARVMALVLGVALSAPACLSQPAQAGKPKAKDRPGKLSVYTVPLIEPGGSLVCVEMPFDHEPPCITVARLRRMVRETETD
jgi:hypothetical protein